jgi:hypothetical protein
MLKQTKKHLSLNLSLASRRKTIITQTIKHKSKTLKKQINTDYPLYKNTYKLNPSRIHNIIKTLPTQLKVLHSPPTGYKNYSPNKFQTLELSHDTRKSRFYIIKSSWNDNIELNSLTDYFTEPCRIQCTFKKNLSPLEYWNKNKPGILASLKKKHLKINNYNLREEMYLRNKPCNNFRISVCLEVLKLFKPKKWLDISAGWGDRLLSALLYDPLELYCGVDPNPCLHPYYQEMIKTFNSTQKTEIKQREFILIQDGFETAKLPNTKFDLVFSSPPFFDLEIYSSAKADSLIKYQGNGAEGWFNGFLMPSLYKAQEHLETGGHLVLYMGEAQGTAYIPKMIELMDARMKNVGMFYYTDGAKIREFFCWRKE